MSDRIRRALALGSLLVITMSCTSLRDHPLFENAPGQSAAAKVELPKLYTEAYIEFAGPGERWAGPPSWVMHIKSSNPPEITINSRGAEQPSAPPHVERVPAGAAAIAPLTASSSSSSTNGASGTTGANNGPTTELVRARLVQLDQWTEQATAALEFRSCLSPIRVKLVRSDGVVSERRGCRVQSSWSTSVSSLVNEFALYAEAATQMRVPAAIPAGH